MKSILASIILLVCGNSFANTDSYFDKYPVGYVSENLLYDLMNQNREKLRQCHQAYLQKLPGGFDSLSLEFQIDPQGYAKPLKSEPASTSKEEALNCLKSLVRSLKFPLPVYGIVFVKFESDIDLQNVATITNLELSRNAVTVVPYVPQKIISSTIDMYMPYYRGCFGKPFIEKTTPGKVSIKWNISEAGNAVDIQITSSIENEKMKQCLTQVTEQQRYPSGYVKTAVERSFNIQKVL